MKFILTKQTGDKADIIKAIKGRLGLGAQEALAMYKAIELNVEHDDTELMWAILDYYEYKSVGSEYAKMYHFEIDSYTEEQINWAKEWFENLSTIDRLKVDILIALKSCPGPVG